MSSKKLPSTEIPFPEAREPGTQSTGSAETRSDRLARLKLAINDGTYKISSEKIAGKIIDLLKDRPPEP